MDLEFRPGLYGCDVAGSLVLLDLPADRYFALSKQASAACLRLAAGGPAQDDDGEIIGRLVGDGVLQPASPGQRPRLCTGVACAGEAHTVGPAHVALARTLDALTRQLFARLDLRCRRFETVLANLARAKRSRVAAAAPSVEPGVLVEAFRAADRLLTPLGQCLPRSIALSRAMIAAGLTPELVLGVKLRPFEAHCWVQQAGMLVGDDVGAIAPFTPILVV